MEIRGTLTIIISLVLLSSVAATQDTDLNLGNSQSIKQTIDSCEGTCSTNDTLSMEKSSDKFILNTGDTGYCGTAGFSAGNLDLNQVKSINFDADIQTGSWAGSTGVRVNGDYVWEKDPSGSSISSDFQNEEADVSHITDDSASVSFIVKDTSKDWCNMFDHTIYAEYSDVTLVKQESDDGDSNDSNSSEDSGDDVAEVIVEVIDGDDNPVSNASVTLDDSGNDDYQTPRYTDQDGRVTFYENTGPAPANQLQVTVNGEKSKSVYMNNGETETLTLQIDEGDENNIEGIDFEITPRVVQGGENVNFNLYSDDGQQLQVSDAKLTISKNGDPVETEESVSLPQSDKLTSESVSEIDWFIEDGNYSFEVSITNNDRELSAEDSLTILVNDGDDNNNSNPINEMDLKLNKQEFKIGEQFKISAVDGEGDEIQGEAQIKVYRGSQMVSQQTTVELPVKEELVQSEVEATDWLTESGTYRFKASKLNQDGQRITDSAKAYFELKDEGERLEIDVSPKKVSPGEEFDISVTNKQGEEVTYEKANVSLYTNGEIQYEIQDQIESDSFSYPDSNDSNYFHGYGSYSLQVDVETSQTVYDDEVNWEVVRKDSPDIYVERIEKQNNTLRATVGLTGTQGASAVSVLGIGKNEEAEEISNRNITLTQGQNSVVYDLPKVSGTEEISVEVKSQNIEESNYENNELTTVIGSSNNETVSLTEGWNMISSQSTVSLDLLADQCNLNPYEGHLAWRFSGGEWSHPETVSGSEGFMVNSAEECTAEVGGEPVNTDETLSKGWNIISVKSPRALTEIEGGCEFNDYRGSKVYQFSGGQWSTPDTDEKLDPSKGYYVNADEACGLETTGDPPTPTGSFLTSATEVLRGVVG